MKLTFLDKIAKREDYKQRYPKKSYGEIDIKIFLDENHIEYKEEVSGTIINYDTGETLNVRIDYYIPKCNIFIEYNGRQHYEPVQDFGGSREFIRQQKRDIWVRNMCKAEGYILIEIPYYDFYDKYFEQILELYNNLQQ